MWTVKHRNLNTTLFSKIGFSKHLFFIPDHPWEFNVDFPWKVFDCYQKALCQLNKIWYLAVRNKKNANVNLIPIPRGFLENVKYYKCKLNK